MDIDVFMKECISKNILDKVPIKNLFGNEINNILKS